jgi:photosystem II stability/assembly factor-like uncharacterized protein
MSRIVTAAATVAACLAVGLASAGAQPATAIGPTVSALAVDGDTVYAATDAGVFKSLDGGSTWQRANDGLVDHDVNDLALGPRGTSVLYAATSSGVFKSVDAGAQWEPTGLRRRAWRVAIASGGAGTAYAGADGRVFRTTNGGAEWDTVFTDELERFFALAPDPRYQTTFYAGGSSGVFKTIDGGFGWRALSRGLLENVTADELKHRILEGFVTALAVDPRHPQTLYLGSDRGVFKSVDGALRWRAVKAGLIGRDSKYKLVGALAIDPRHPRTVYAGAGWGSRTGTGLFKTTNGGRRWRFTALPDNGFVSTLAVDPREVSIVYAATQIEGRGDLFKSADAGRTWRALAIPRP